MYTAFFGLNEKPFGVTADARFFYSNPAHEEAHANLVYGIQERKGLLLLTGEVGTGKTTLLQRLMNELESTVRFVFFYNTTLTFADLLTFVCEELSLSFQDNSQLSKISALNTFLLSQLSKGSTTVLFIDEAQNLRGEVFENLRLLSNLETPKEKLLQIVLAGQPELDVKLESERLRQVRQRIFSHSRLTPLGEEEVAAYIDHRLKAAGYAGGNLFQRASIREIVRYSNGIPRLINIICDNALLIAYAASQHKVTIECVQEVADDLRLTRNQDNADSSSWLALQRKRGRSHNTTASATSGFSPSEPGNGAVSRESKPRVENVDHIVPPAFFEVLKTALTEAMGPMASMVIADHLVSFRSSPGKFPKGRAQELIDSVSTEILNEDLKSRFEKQMSRVIVYLNGTAGSLARASQ
jgi:general secretion pathway protein A